jgi:homoaconitase/3-isopropylmalate dehydratase large subunit
MDSHVVRKIEDGPDVFFIDRHFIHEVTSPVAFLGLKERAFLFVPRALLPPPITIPHKINIYLLKTLCLQINYEH